MSGDGDGPIPNGWAECKIGDVTLSVGKVDPKKNGGKAVAYVDISSIDNARNLIGDVKTYVLLEAPSRARQIIRAGDVLFSTVRPYLKNIAAVPEVLDGHIASTGFSVLRPAPGVDPKFLFYKATSSAFVNALSGAQYGVSYPAVRDSQVREQVIRLPPTAEQGRIVSKIEELFSRLDKGIESLQIARTRLEVYRQSLLRYAFQGKLTATWREENPDELETPEDLIARIGKERLSSYEVAVAAWKAAVHSWEERGRRAKKPRKPTKPNPITLPNENTTRGMPTLPKGWCWVRVKDLCEVVRGGSPRPAGDPRYYDGDIPFLKVADLTRTPGAYIDSHSYSIKPAGLTKTRFVQPPVLMLSNSGATLGVPKICRIEATFNDGIAAFLDIRESDLLYHYYFWASKTLELRGIDQGAAQPNLNTDLIGDVLIPVCSRQEMQAVSREIDRMLSASDHLLSELHGRLGETDMLRTAILNAAFSGKLVPQDPRDEPASALLVRIRAAQEAPSNGKKKQRAAT